MKKVAVLIPTASILVGGGEIYPLNQARELAKRKDIGLTIFVLDTTNPTTYFKNFVEGNRDLKIVALGLNNDKLQKEIEEGIHTDKIHEVTHQLYHALSRSFNNICIKESFDSVITHYAPAVFCVPGNVECILLLHGTPSFRHPTNHLAVHTADELYSVSKSIASEWAELHDLEREKIDVLYNGINEDQYYPIELKRDIDIFYVGRLIEIKGIQHLIKAVSIVNNKFGKENLKVVIGGKGPYLEQLQKLAGELKLEDQIEFAGFVRDEEMIKLYNRSKICIFPSYKKEGVLTTMLEAAACGRAVITANCCGMVDFAKDGFNALLFEPENSEDLAEKINRLLSDESLRSEIGDNARKSILQNWTWDKTVEKIYKHLTT